MLQSEVYRHRAINPGASALRDTAPSRTRRSAARPEGRQAYRSVETCWTPVIDAPSRRRVRYVRLMWARRWGIGQWTFRRRAALVDRTSERLRRRDRSRRCRASARTEGRCFAAAVLASCEPRGQVLVRPAT